MAGQGLPANYAKTVETGAAVLPIGGRPGGLAQILPAPRYWAGKSSRFEDAAEFSTTIPHLRLGLNSRWRGQPGATHGKQLRIAADRLLVAAGLAAAPLALAAPQDVGVSEHEGPTGWVAAGPAGDSGLLASGMAGICR